MMTASKRAKIYREAAQLESESYGAGIDHLVYSSGLSILQFYKRDVRWKTYPELKQFDYSVEGIAKKNRQDLRALALLFCWQIALSSVKHVKPNKS